MCQLSAGRLYAEDYHQQYVVKNPNGYCAIGGCGFPFEIPANA